MIPIKPALFAWMLLFLNQNLLAGGFLDRFIDPRDGYFDTSEWLATRTGFLPVPIIITEPAVGYGGGAALTFFHGEFKGVEVESRPGETRRVPPSVSAVAAGGTENGTWFLGGGHLGIWKNDDIRYIGGAGYGEIKMDYYGTSSQLRHPVSFDSAAWGLLQEFKFRIRDSRFFAGLGYRLVDTKNRFHPGGLLPIPGLPAIGFDSRSAGIQFSLSYDSRDNVFTPNRGLDTELKAEINGHVWGGDDDFKRYSAYLKYYRPFAGNWVAGLRLDGKTLEGDAPFYEYPFVDMRGIKIMRYQGKRTALGELELRWTFHPRWTLVGFGGAARTWAVQNDTASDNIYSKDLGIRYLIASKLGLQFGLDIAQGPEDTAVYFQVGSAWLR